MTTQLKYIKLCLLFLLLTAGCSEVPFDSRVIHIRLVITDNTPEFPLNNIPIVIKNQTIGNSYTQATDIDGKADIKISPGICSVSFSHRLTKGMTTYNLSGGLASLTVEPGNQDLYLELPVSQTTAPQLVIEELYFSGCMRIDNKTHYTSDQYLAIANNSDQTVYLDGLCIAQAAPYTTAKPSNWMQLTDMKEIPLAMMCWQFPGNGTDNPLESGQRQIIATNAVDHTSGPAGVAASLNLSHVEWAFWNAALTSSQITAGVRPLNLVWHGSAKVYALTVSGPTILLFLPQSDMTAWVADNSHIGTEPETTSKLQYLYIPAEWVIDVANFVTSAVQTANSRIPLTMDPSPGLAGPTGSGFAWRREHRKEGNRTVWETGRGTSRDFSRQQPSMKDNSGTN
ncbi:DUF4876 domain-containing protein [uncultured Parabacteroides sp.]|uniref:DUF4876 domain-containing protein n=1 Tax=uncultured Parabacteroides sp. TaxID=512312 RepID=UPI00258FB98F|nr:DUF4876 domain-containing protein [uncultured Parabacteroides sp.]